MKQSDQIAALLKRIEDLEAQVRLLNARPVFVMPIAHQPVLVPVPSPAPQPWALPPWRITCGAGSIFS